LLERQDEAAAQATRASAGESPSAQTAQRRQEATLCPHSLGRAAGFESEATLTFDPDWCIHPGGTLLEVLTERELTQAEAARSLGISQKHMNQIVKGKVLYSAKLAVQLEALTNVKAEFWMNLKTNYELGLARGKAVAA
jgi:addiction module HigA family antidote